jgi:hypothetical protein
VQGFNQKQAIREVILRLSKWFRKPLDADQAAEYLRALKFIPAEALEEIAQEIIEDTPATPGRFPTPAQIKGRFYLWQAGHPNKRADYPKTDCPVCQSEFGLLHGAREQEGITYRVVARCAACENWLEHFARSSPVPLMRPEQLEAQGYVLEYPPKAPARPQPIKQLAAQVGGHANPGERRAYFDRGRP